MPIRRMGGGGTGGHGGGGSIELAAAYVSIMPETSKVSPGVRRVAQQAGQALNAEISGAMQTAFKRSETYATGFGQAVARENLAATRSYNSLIDRTDAYRGAQDNLNKVMSNKKSTAADVANAVSQADRAERQWMAGIEEHGVKLAAFNAKQQKYATDQATASQRLTATQQREFERQNTQWQRNLRTTQGFLAGHQKFIDDTSARAKKLFDPPNTSQMASGFRRAQTQMRDELNFTAQQGETRWARMTARMSLSNLGGANSIRGSFGSALDEMQNRANKTFEGVRRGALDAFGAPLGVRASAAGAGLLGGYAVFSGVDRVLSGGFQRLQTIQNAQVAMTTILGDQQKAMDLVKQVSNAAIGTPFGADAFLQMARNMTTMGVATNQVLPAITALGDAGAIMGRSPADLDSLSREFGKIKAEGRLMGRDVYELQRVGGINAREIIANHLGMTGEELTKQMGQKGGLNVNADEIIQTLIEGIEKGSTGTAGTTPAYQGGMAKQRQTVTGALNVLKSQADRIGASFLQPFFDRLPHAVDTMTNKFRNMADPDGPISQFSNRLANLGGGALFEKMFTGIPGLLTGMMNLANKAMDALQSPGAQRALGIIKQDLGEIWNVAKQTWPVFQRLAGTLTQGFGTVAIAGLTLFKDTLELLAPPLRVVAGFFADNKAITEGLIGVWALLALKSKVVETAMRPLSSVMGAFSRQVYDTSTGVVRSETMWNRMATSFRSAKTEADGLGGTLRGSLKAGMSGLRDMGSGLMGAFGGPWGLAATGAITGVTLVLGEMAAAQQHAAEATERHRQAEAELMGQMDQTTGAMTREAQATIAKNLQDSGATDAAKRLGIDPHQVFLASSGDQGATHQLDQQLADMYKYGVGNPEDIKKVGSAISAQIGLWQGAMQKILGVNEALNGTHQLTQAGVDALKGWGAEIDSIPSDKEIVVKADTDQAKANVKALQDQGFTVEQDLNDPNKFRITANTDEAVAKLAAFLYQVNTSTPQLHIGATTDPAQTVLNDFIAQIQGHAPVSFPVTVQPPAPGDIPGLLLPPPGGGNPGPTPPGFPVPRVAIAPPGGATGGRLDSSGILYGAGNGVSDSIPGLVDGMHPVALSHLESVNNRRSTMQNWPWIDAMNKGLNLARMGMPHFDTGGLLGWWGRRKKPPVTGPGLNPLLAPVILGDPDALGRQAAAVDQARTNLFPAQGAANQQAAAAYTGAPTGPFDPRAQDVFGARRNFTAQASLLDSMNSTAAAFGRAGAALGPIPANVGVQSYPPVGSVLNRSFDALNRGSYGLIPNVPKDFHTATNWGSASGADRLTAGLDLASFIPIPGMGAGAEAFRTGVRAAGEKIVPDALRASVAHPSSNEQVMQTLADVWMRIGSFNSAKPFVRQGTIDAIRHGYAGIADEHVDEITRKVSKWADGAPISQDEADMINRLMARAAPGNQLRPVTPTAGGVPFEVQEILRSLGREVAASAVHAGPSDRTMWRGMKLSPETIASYQRGQQISFPPSSFTQDKGSAVDFAASHHGWQTGVPENWQSVLFRVPKGSGHFADTSYHDPWGSILDEHLGFGNYAVRGVKPSSGGNPTEVVLRQLGLDPKNFQIPRHLQTPWWELGHAKGGMILGHGNQISFDYAHLQKTHKFARGGLATTSGFTGSDIDPRDYSSPEEFMQAWNLARFLGFLHEGQGYRTGGIFPWWSDPGNFGQSGNPRTPLFSPHGHYIPGVSPNVITNDRGDALSPWGTPWAKGWGADPRIPAYLTRGNSADEDEGIFNPRTAQDVMDGGSMWPDWATVMAHPPRGGGPRFDQGGMVGGRSGPGHLDPTWISAFGSNVALWLTIHGVNTFGGSNGKRAGGRFAGGGRMIRGPGTGTSDSIPGLVDGVNPILVSHGESINTARATAMNWPVIDAMNKGAMIPPGILRAMGVRGFADGGGLGAAYQTGYAMNGKPYANTFGDAAADCSGFVSMIVNAATGMGAGGGARMTTQTAGEWLRAHGAVIGTPPGPGFLTVGWYNHGSGIQDGHMAGTMPDGTNFEAGGPQGQVTFGGGATGASASEFDQHAWFPYTALYPDGSVTVPPGSPPTTPYGGAGSGAAGATGGGNMTPKQLQALQNQVAESGDKVVSTQHDIEIAQAHIDDLNKAKTPPKEATMLRAQETLRRAQDAHGEALSKQSQLQGQLATAQTAGPSGGGAGGKGSDQSGADLGKTIVNGMFESLGIDGSVFSDPRQWTGVKSMIALMNWFMKPIGSDSVGANMTQMSQGGLPPGYASRDAMETATDPQGQMADAIVRAGLAQGAGPNELKASLMAGMQESGLTSSATNGQHVGPFQMDAAKGTEEQRRDPNFAANWFFTQAMQVPGHEKMDPGQLAEAVERSGQGAAYGPHAAAAENLMNAALGRVQGTSHGAANMYGPGPGNTGQVPTQADSGYNNYTAQAPTGGGGISGVLGGVMNAFGLNIPIPNNGQGLLGPYLRQLGVPGANTPGVNTPEAAPGFTPPDLQPVAPGAPPPPDMAPPAPQFATDSSGIGDDGMTPGVANVGNVSFYLAKGATLGWDPHKAFNTAATYTNMKAKEAGGGRTVIL